MPTTDAASVTLADPYPIVPFDGPIDAVVQIPGSKSITNRALLCAALATGTTQLSGVLHADDTEAMLSCISALGAKVRATDDPPMVDIEGVGGQWAQGPITVNARMSGTTARFVAPSLVFGRGAYSLDGVGSMRHRPMGDLVRALNGAGVRVEATGDHFLPMTVHAGQLSSCPTFSVPGDVSSQFLSGLLLNAPCWPEGAVIRVEGVLVSRPYVDMTIAVMRSFGASVVEVESVDNGSEFFVEGSGYTSPGCYVIEPDASAASYAFAAAVITGGSVTVPGLGSASTQGDLRFALLLRDMGAEVQVAADHTTVKAGASLHGIDVDMSDCSDTAQTLAVVAAHADSPTRVTGIGFIRNKECDRVAAVPAELNRCGINATEDADGFSITPGHAHPAVVETYKDHRMAMSFALLGLRNTGIEISDPSCVAKTFPAYFEVLESMRPKVSSL